MTPRETPRRNRTILRLASYNIRKAVGLDWRRDPGRICDVLAEIDAEIVVLQEADKRVGTREGVLPLDRLAQEMGYHLADVSIRPQSHGWHGNALLVRDGYRIAETRRIDLPSVEPRGAVSVRLGAPSLEVIGVHLGLNGTMRRRQLAVLGDHVRTAGHPVVIAGDFNEWRRGSDHVEDLGQVIEPGASFHASVPVAALDKFILCGDLRPMSFHVHRSPLAARASDHLPVVLEIETDAKA
ncbi:MAG: endonuclease [Rhodobacteraceae bacterium]|nr:MAG: endonuclease [Paracoccaceae bacterium]